MQNFRNVKKKSVMCSGHKPILCLAEITAIMWLQNHTVNSPPQENKVRNIRNLFAIIFLLKLMELASSSSEMLIRLIKAMPIQAPCAASNDLIAKPSGCKFIITIQNPNVAMNLFHIKNVKNDNYLASLGKKKNFIISSER